MNEHTVPKGAKCFLFCVFLTSRASWPKRFFGGCCFEFFRTRDRRRASPALQRTKCCVRYVHLQREAHGSTAIRACHHRTAEWFSKSRCYNALNTISRHANEQMRHAMSAALVPRDRFPKPRHLGTAPNYAYAFGKPSRGTQIAHPVRHRGLMWTLSPDVFMGFHSRLELNPVEHREIKNSRHSHRSGLANRHRIVWHCRLMPCT